MRIRPRRPDDVAAAERLTAVAMSSVGPHVAGERTPEQRKRGPARLHHLLGVDPGGSWVCDDGGTVVGVAAAARRDLLWVLSTYAVDPDYQDRGAGRALLAAAIGYGAGCLRGFICSTRDSRAVRRYRLAGFTLHPTMQLRGELDRSALPIVDGVAAAGEPDGRVLLAGPMLATGYRDGHAFTPLTSNGWLRTSL